VKEAVGSIFFVITVLVVVVFLPLMGLWKLRIRRNKTLAAERALANERYENALRHPDYPAFAARYGCAPPAPLRQLYESASSDLAGGFELRFPSFPKAFFIAYFMEIGNENMSIVWPGTEGFFPFADDGCGNRYIVNPGEADPLVYFYDHELHERESLNVTLSQFLAAKRAKVGRW